MNEFLSFLESMIDTQKRDKMEEILTWINKSFTYLTPKIMWNQPIFLDHGTFIIGLSYSKKHISIAIEMEPFERFKDAILASGYKCSKMLFSIEWEAIINYSLLQEIIEYIIKSKKMCNSFWQK